VYVGLAVTSHADGAAATATFDGFALTPIVHGLPIGWVSGDVGAPGAAGDATFDGTAFTVRGSGADIWGTADGFHYAHTTVLGDFDISARVASLDPLHPWTKAGLMIRDGLAPEGRHASVFATPTVNGVAFQRRAAVGAQSVHTAGPVVAPPVWLRLRREGDVITALARSADEAPWGLIGTQTLTNLPEVVHVGLAVTSHVDGAIATARFDNLAVEAIGPGLPGGWTSSDVGAVEMPGQASYDNGTFTVKGTGADIWGTADAFQFVYRRFAGDFDVRARVASLSGPHEWAKAGLMVRESLEPGSSHHFLLASALRGLAHQYRPVPDGPTFHSALPQHPLPAWFRIERTLGTVQLYVSLDGTVWTAIASTGMHGEVLVGLAVTSHDAAQSATATFDNVQVATGAVEPWTSGDVGAVGAAGSTTFDGVTYTVSGNGGDIWGSSDAFRFMHHPMSGDGSVTARVATLQGLESWAKAGVMIRASTDPSAAHAFMFVSLGHGLAFQRRVADGGTTTHTGGGAASPPRWVRLTRAGPTIAASVSADGVDWIEVGSDQFPGLPADVLAGLAVTSHDEGTLATATFDHLQIQVSGAPALALTAPAPGSTLRATTATFEWSGPGDEFWLEVGSAPGRSDLYASGSLGTQTRHTVSGLPLNGTTLHVRLRRRIGAATDLVTAAYTAPIRRGLAVITDFQDRHFEDLLGAGMKSEDDLARQLRKMEDHWLFLSRGLEVIRWEIVRVELPYSSPDDDPDPFDGNWVLFREAAARALLEQARIADYDVDTDGELDAAWFVVSHGGLPIWSAIGGASRNLNVNMFVDGQASASVTGEATGNFNHELGHLVGLPDTYGAFDSLHGLTLMSFSWPLPPHDFSAFERVRLGWVKPQIVTETTRGVWLPPAHDVLAAVRIPTSRPDEYFLMEYRRRPASGYGSAYFLPYDGLAIYHVREGSNNNTDPPLVKLEPADGVNTYDGVLHHDDFVSPENPALLRPLVIRSYFGDRPEIFRIEDVQWRDGGIAFDVVIPEVGDPDG
jgi:M6 family metalloprotease-like protein